MFDVDMLVQRIGKVSHFKGLSPSDLREIVTAGSVRHYSAGQVIYSEGDACAGLFVLFRGRVHLCKVSPQGQESIIGVIEPVIMFNEVAVLDRGSNPMTAIAERSCITWRLSPEDFHRLMDRYPVVGLSLLRILASRYRLLLSFCEDVAFRSVTGRTAKLILDLSQQGRKTIDRRLHTNQVLAARVATVPEPLCRAIHVLRQNGLINCTRTSITVKDAGELARLAEITCGCLE